MAGPDDDWAPVKTGDDDWAPVAKPAPEQEPPPAAFLDRIKAGSYLTGDIGGALPEAHAKFFDTFEGRQLKGAWDMFTLPGRVASGETKLNTEQGLNEAIGMGVGIALGRMNEMPGNGAGAPVIDQGSGRFARPFVDENGKPQVAPIGNMPRPEDFTNAAKVLAPEQIAGAAIRSAEGKVFAGINHADAGTSLFAAGHTLSPTEAGDGFVTSNGRFVDRDEALTIAKKNEQLSNPDFMGPDSLLHARDLLNIEINLKRLWQDEGIHPAEAVHDAQTDAFFKNEITAYHGSPHSFDAFSTANIGAGEGAQAYGHGLYFAENAKVAVGYQERLATNYDYIRKGLPEGSTNADYAAHGLVQKKGSITAARQAAQEAINDGRDSMVGGSFSEDPKEILKSLNGIPETDKGHLYQVRINVDPDKLLDWDKPLSEQPQAVRDIVKEHNLKWYESNTNRMLATDESQLTERAEEPTGAEIYQELQGRRAFKANNLRNLKGEVAAHVSSLMSDAGIPGIKYLDQGSRDAGDGTRNFVIFNEGDIQITHKNSVPVAGYDIPREDYDALVETGGAMPQSLGAAMTDPPLVSPDVQPPRPPGSLAASFTTARDKLFDVGRDAQMLVSPMATGTRDSMAIAKDFANSMRRNRWDWNRIDTDIATKFTPEQREFMWIAADEESVLRQTGENPVDTGLLTLSPNERAAVDELQTRAQNAWVRAQDIGMVKGEALPAYTPRMVLNVGTTFADDKALPLNSIGQNLRIRTAQMLKRKHLTVEETERAAKDYVGMREALRGKSVEEINAAIDKVHVARDIRALPLATAKLEDAIAGRTLINSIKEYGERTGTETVSEGSIPVGREEKWFTLDHPAFRSWRPQLRDIDGKMQAVKDAQGNTIFEQVPLYVHGDFEGPLRAVLSSKSGATYGAMMALKGKTMSLIMNSPMIHNAVEWGRAFPAAPFKVGTFKVYFDGNRVKNDVGLMHEAIDAGLVPIGHRFFNQDITSVMESPDLTPGRSLTAKALALVPGLFDEAAGTAVKRAIDKAGDFWHNTLLWDRVADLQAGLYKNFLDAGIEKGIDRQTSARVAAHMANRYAGSLPKEAMSDGATKLANLLLFSRSFTLGNIGVMKDMLTGLPKDVMAQIERDAGFRAGSINEAGELNSPVEDAAAMAKSMARRKAISTVVLDVGLLTVGNSVLQSALNVMLGSNTLDQEGHGYIRRFKDYLDKGSQHPLSMLWPANIAGLSSTAENEPGLENRLKIGHTKDGTAIYARNPVGKIGEEFTGWGTGPLDMLRKKQGTIARPLLQILSNDGGFGRKIYDPDADTPAKYAGTVWAIAKHLAGSQLPEGQLGALSDLVTGQGDKTVNELQLAGPLAGVTFRKGAPGGEAVGEMYHNKSAFEFRVQQAMPDIRRQILRGDIPGAQQAMTGLGMDASYSRWVVKTTQNPATRLGAKALGDFYRTATPEQRDRMTRIQQAPQPQQ